MKNLFLAVLLNLIVQLSFGQTKISGKVTDGKSPVPGANISIKGSYDGASSDAKGDFSFTTQETGKQTILVTFIGFEPFEQAVELNGKEINLKIALKEKINELNTVTISAGAIEASDEKKAVLLRPLDIVTTAGANGDIYGALQTLPGTQPIGETEGLFVRGGDASETKTIIDGLAVQHPYSSSVPDIAQRGRFSPFLFKNTVFSTGGYSALYGQAMSSALLLETQDLPDRSNNTFISLMSVGGGIGHMHKWNRFSAGFDLNYANLRPYFLVFKQNVDWARMPQAGGGSFIARYKTSKTGLLKLYGTQSFSDQALYIRIDSTGNPSLFDLKNSNNYVNLSYKEILGLKWSVYTVGSFSYNQDKRGLNERSFTSSDNTWQGKLVLTRTLGKLSTLRFGGETDKTHYLNGFFPISYTGFAPFFGTVNENFYTGFSELDWYLNQRLVLRIGGRYEYSDLVSRSNLAPRLSMAYKTGINSQVSVAYGDFFQTPGINYMVYGKDLGYQKATHYIANYQFVSDKRTFRVEAYYKKYNDLIRFASFNTINNSGDGYSKGIDVFLRDKQTFKFVDYWISYSYLDTKRNYLYYVTSAQPTFAATNTFSLVVKRFFMKLKTSAGFTYTYASGRPYFNPNKVSESDFLSDRTKDYHNLSVNFSYLTNIKGHFTVVALSCSNVLGIENVYSYRFLKDGSRIPIMAPAPRFAFIGIFINIGKDKYEGED